MHGKSFSYISVCISSEGVTLNEFKYGITLYPETSLKDFVNISDALYCFPWLMYSLYLE